MSNAMREGKGGLRMAQIWDMDAIRIEQSAKEMHCEVASYLFTNGFWVAGAQGDIEGLMQMVRKRSMAVAGKNISSKTKEMSVAAGFHTSFMSSCQPGLDQVLDHIGARM